MKGKNRLLLFILIVIISLGFHGSLKAQGLAAADEARYQRFSRGINLPYWFWLNRAPLRPLERVYSDKDLELVRKLGLTYVRVPVDMANIYDPNREDLLQPEALDLLLSGLRKIINSGLAVNFDLHSISQQAGGSDYSGPLGKDAAFTERFFVFWERLARKLADFDPDWLIVEPMNEPVFLGEEGRWPPLQKELIARIRAVLPRHTILATGAFWSNLSTLLTLEPLADAGVWYCFHFYEPHLFTHQGAHWSSELVKKLRRVPYPSSPQAVGEAISLVQQEDLKQALRAYGQESWNATRIEERIGQAAAWAARHRVRLICNEFGAYRIYCLPSYRVAWIKDVRTALEKHGISWAMWEFEGGFGLIYRRDGKAIVDRQVAQALGLKLD
ncbi:MAG: cellulase family glycosylhydrolase [Candidatus Aminicenantes bacterium]|nr:cellulase family glycosylhydrolase [Candidatus Aminicenantes bacterium]